MLDKAKKKCIFATTIRSCYVNTTFIKSLKGGLPLMKKLFVIFVAMLFVASLSLSVVGCKKAEEAAPAPKVEAPVAQPAPVGTTVPASVGTTVPAPAK